MFMCDELWASMFFGVGNGWLERTRVGFGKSGEEEVQKARSCNSCTRLTYFGCVWRMGRVCWLHAFWRSALWCDVEFRGGQSIHNHYSTPPPTITPTTIYQFSTSRLGWVWSSVVRMAFARVYAWICWFVNVTICVVCMFDELIKCTLDITSWVYD